MANLSTFIQRMVWWCTHGNLGYDQGNRWDLRVGGETDCSALVIGVLRETGFKTGSATYTGNMRAALTSNGWKVAATYPTSTRGLKAGDILLNDLNHVAVYVGGGLVAQASIDENGRIVGGRAGDQTNYETSVRSFYVYPHGGWNAVLRYAAPAAKPAPKPQKAKGTKKMLMIHKARPDGKKGFMYGLASSKFFLQFTADGGDVANGFARQVGASSIKVSNSFWEHVVRASLTGTNIPAEELAKMGIKMDDILK